MISFLVKLAKFGELFNITTILFLLGGLLMKKLASILAALSLSLVGTSVFAGGSDCWGNGGADVSTDKIKQEKMDKEA